MWGYLDDPRLFFLFCVGCSWVPCLFWTVELSTVLQTNPPRSVDSAVFQHFLHIWTLSSSDCMILRSIFSHWGQLMDSNTTIKKGSKHSLMLQKNTRCIKSWLLKTFEQDEDFQLFSFVEIYIFFPFITALRKQQKILACFPEDKLSTIYLDLQIQKVFTPRLLMHRVFLLEHQWMFEPFLIVCLSPSIVLSVKRWISKSYSHCWKGFKYAKMLENCRIYRTWRICLKNSAQLNCSEQTRDSWTTITKQKNSRGSSR